jgi:gamma-glutamyltranspeptidase/glutathione hydrolase
VQALGKRVELSTASAVSHTGAVATAFPDATEAALEILRAGGNAIDAAVAAAWALSVCEPSASGIGGQTVLLIRLVDGEIRVIDGHSYGPAAASCATISKEQQRVGYRSCTIPSTPAALQYAHQEYGILTRHRVMTPAIHLAETGYRLTKLQHRQMRQAAGRSGAPGRLHLLLSRSTEPGGLFRQPQLARTLRRLADVGIEDFYTGEVGRRIARDMAEQGGLITEQDLADFALPAEAEPISATYRDYTVVSVPPPGGGLVLLQALKILEQLTPAGGRLSDNAWYEAIAATVFSVFSAREAQPIAPEHLDSALRRWLLSDLRAERIVAEITSGGGIAREKAGFREEPGDTTHLSVADRWGNVVALTQSIQSVFGAKVANHELGFFYNNYLRTCLRRSAHPSALGPHCRPRSNAAPTLVLRSDLPASPVALVLGAAGSRRITSALLQVISLVLDRGLDIVAAVAAPRLHALVSRAAWIEAPAASATLLARLEPRFSPVLIKRRHHYALAAVQALQFTRTGDVMAAADPRRDGTAALLAGDEE